MWHTEQNVLQKFFKVCSDLLQKFCGPFLTVVFQRLLELLSFTVSLLMHQKPPAERTFIYHASVHQHTHTHTYGKSFAKRKSLNYQPQTTTHILCSLLFHFTERCFLHHEPGLLCLLKRICSFTQLWYPLGDLSPDPPPNPICLQPCSRLDYHNIH